MKTRSRLVRRGATAALALLGTAILSSPLCAQGQNQTAAVSFPPNAASWINSTPIVAEKLAGKAVVLYFFEES